MIDSGWFVGYLAIALGAYCASGPASVAHRPDPASPSLVPIAAPFFPVLLALGVIGVEVQLGHRPDGATTAIALALVALVLARQALLLVDLLSAGAEGEGGLRGRLQAGLLDTIRDSATTAPTRPPDRSQP